MKEKIEQIIARMSPGLGGTVVKFVEEKQGVVRVNIFVPSCGPAVSSDLVLEYLEEQFSKIPGFKEVVEDN